MNTINHRDLVAALAKPGHEILSELTEADAHLIHMIMGVVGEAGELLDAIKKATMYRKPIDIKHVIEEMGDIEFYMEGIRQNLMIERDDVLDANIKKLSKRYPGGKFSNDDAQARADKAGSEWVIWNGAQSAPVTPGTRLTVRFRDGAVFGPDRCSEHLVWEHTGKHSDIVAYRVEE